MLYDIYYNTANQPNVDIIINVFNTVFKSPVLITYSSAAFGDCSAVYKYVINQPGFSIKHNAQLTPDQEFFTVAYVTKLAYESNIRKQKAQLNTALLNISTVIKTSLGPVLHAAGQDQAAALVKMSNALIDTIDLARLESDTLKLDLSLFNLRETIEDAASAAGIQAQITIEKSVPGYVFSDSKRIKQIIINLLTNAWRYSNQTDDSVVLYADAILMPDLDNKYEISILVYNDGSLVNNTALFTKTTTLRISSMLASLLNGSLQLAYSDQARGTCFKLTLVLPEEEPVAWSSKTLQLLKGLPVLLVAQKNERHHTEQVLHEYEMKIYIADTIEEAEVLYSKTQVRVVIADRQFRAEPFIQLNSDIKEEILKAINDPLLTEHVLIVDRNSDLVEKMLLRVGYRKIDHARGKHEARLMLHENKYQVVLINVDYCMTADLESDFDHQAFVFEYRGCECPTPDEFIAARLTPIHSAAQ